MRYLLLLLLLAGVVIATPKKSIEVDDMTTKQNTKVLMKTSKGDILIELFDSKAPATVENFLTYVDEGFYKNTMFHRVIDGFMIQGGGFEAGFEQKETHAPITNEADNGVKNDRGTLAMARTGDPHSATAQFFINVSDNDFLNFKSPDPQGWGYAVFGRVQKGMDVVDTIKSVDTTTVQYYQDVPKEDITILSVSLIKE